MKADDLFQIIIYLIILAIGGIISANRAKSKKRPTVQPSSSPKFGTEFDTSTKPAPNPLDEFLKRFEIQEIPDEIEKQEVEINSESQPETPFESESDSLEEIVNSPEEEGIPAFINKDLTNTSVEEYDMDNFISSGQISDSIGTEQTDEGKEYNFAENIVQGIIYSEILKRKQF